MTHQETKESNILIAEFMGAKIRDNLTIKNYLDISLPDYAFSLHDFDLLKIGSFEYHTSWDWLMPVILKIGQYQYRVIEGIKDYAYPYTFGMQDEEGEYMFRFNRHQLFSADTLIEAAWLAVVDFIKWYNEQS